MQKKQLVLTECEIMTVAVLPLWDVYTWCITLCAPGKARGIAQVWEGAVSTPAQLRVLWLFYASRLSGV